MKKYNEQLAAFERYLKAADAYSTCMEGIDTTSCKSPGVVNPPPLLQTLSMGPDPALTPQQTAYMAVARLHLTPPKPAIGPPPEINEWKMAAVGYPMWLWAEGNLNPAPVSDTVYDLTVSLDAHLDHVTYDLGDGHRITCTDVTHPWVRGTTPAAPSPSCGYTYTKPSLPKGEYTITATSDWAVEWRVNGAGGTVHLYQQASTQLPVGELQVLVR